ncbi:MAG: Methylated-DNA--protein-cysteine methyltransferase [Thermocaproicibacter melissae]|jgi:methylated-DNA-[protein]-cysteine S-methyltransferase|uniref:methylated-DNA--[protein]-cysteine S-methyltransferase n=1 Tax=Thermocaproicibacter melissae TaxID=2966552 RepID=UPI0024B208EE|nr:methylated-DNA--[protein]-cysteine S-methyltransferase [Thermocaproicibacter melissae]WBY63427.1 methylated-DNA--[protein]-cysteine S-methyltransferase [Thermocaproicibacter melissae]
MKRYDGSRFCRWHSPIGTLVIVEDGEGITKLSLAENAPADSREEMTPLLWEAVQQLSEYFVGKRKEFSLPLSLHGTPFQLADWEALRTIPYGETRSYRQIAEQIGKPKACRAVGMANHKNPIAIMIPCHRVIAADRSLGGYGYGPKVKRFLLELEKRHIG